MTSSPSNCPGDHLLGLLQSKVREAEVTLREQLDRELFGEKEKEMSYTRNATGGVTGYEPPSTAKKLLDDMSRNINSYTKPPDRYVVSPKDYERIVSEMKTSTGNQILWTSVSDMQAGYENVLWKGVPITHDKTIPDGNAYAVNLEQSAATWTGVTFDYEKESAKIPMTKEVLGDALNHYKSALTDNIFRESPLTAAMKKENTMSITKQIRAEINEKKEEKRVRKALKKFEGSWLYKLDKGAHIGWDVQFDEGGETYSYAAIFDGKRWHLTGARSLQRITTDDLVDWFIENEVDFKAVQLYKPVR